jgi:hypothetical protein
VPATTIGLDDVAAHVERREIDQRLVAVISTAACAKSSSDRARPSPVRGPRMCELRVNQRRATRSRAPSRGLRSSRRGATGSSDPAADLAVPSRARRTADTAPRRIDRSRRRRGSRSAAHRMDGPARPATRWRPQTSELACSCVCPSPWAALYGETLARTSDFSPTLTRGC